MLHIAMVEQADEQSDGRNRLLLRDFPYLEAEVVFAARHDWAVHPEDVLARRTRLAFVDKDAAIRAIPRVVELMAAELRWDGEKQRAETLRCVEYLRHFGGSKPIVTDSQRLSVRMATPADLRDVFRKVDLRDCGAIDRQELQLAGEMLAHPLSAAELDDCMSCGRVEGQPALPDRIDLKAFSAWWNGERLNPGLEEMRRDKTASAATVQGPGTLFG